MPVNLKNMRNLVMKGKLEKQEAIDVSGCERDGSGNYILKRIFYGGYDYCDAIEERWILSIGRHRETGMMVASTDNRFYNNPAYDCLWLR